jgi:hypothetical protein
LSQVVVLVVQPEVMMDLAAAAQVACLLELSTQLHLATRFQWELVELHLVLMRVTTILRALMARTHSSQVPV